MLVLVVARVSDAEGTSVEWRPMIGGGYSQVVDPHGSLSAAGRIQLGRFFFVQPEYLVLIAEGHTDHGPTLMLGLSGGKRDGLRPFVGLGGGPVKGYQGDDGILFLAFGGSYRISREHSAFIQGEIRLGLLGESAYSQLGVAIGISR
jgi:hypothetical protein